jgi:hypothetical protein
VDNINMADAPTSAVAITSYFNTGMSIHMKFFIDIQVLRAILSFSGLENF